VMVRRRNREARLQSQAPLRESNEKQSIGP
jgi:hypothetical protein